MKYENFKIENIDIKNNSVYIFLRSNGFSESYIKKLRNNPSSILINNTPSTTKSRLKDGDTLQILQNVGQKTILPHSDTTLNILYEDDDYLFVNKPHNLACMPSRSHYDDNLGNQICSYLQNKDENFVLRILNRLDKDTAGIVAIAKNLHAYKNFQYDNKFYHAICHGKLGKEAFSITSPILTINNNGINQMKRVISPNGKLAITHAKLLKSFKKHSLVELSLETGRTHQIRVHLASIGHSLVGDSIYCDTHNIDTEPSHSLLILKLITFTHFRNNKKISLQVPYPEIWSSYIS